MWTDCELYGCDLEGEGLGMFLRLVGGRYPFKGKNKEYRGRISIISSEGYDFWIYEQGMNAFSINPARQI